MSLHEARPLRAEYYATGEKRALPNQAEELASHIVHDCRALRLLRERGAPICPEILQDIHWAAKHLLEILKAERKYHG